MITIPQKVEEIVNRSPYLREGMSNDLINYSALARYIKPQIEHELFRDVTEAAIVMALQRHGRQMKRHKAANPGYYLRNLTLRTSLFEVTVANSSSLMSRLSPLMNSFQHDRSLLFVYTQGLHETSIIASNSLEGDIKDALNKETITSQIDGLTAISLQRMHDHLNAIGVLMYPLRILAWQGISVVEIVTTLNELMIIIEDKDIDRAVVSVRQALHSASLDADKLG